MIGSCEEKKLGRWEDWINQDKRKKDKVLLKIKE